MGTNFYWRPGYRMDSEYNTPRHSQAPYKEGWDVCANPAIHIGKRSAAGYFCWDCQRTLTQGGPNHVHGVGCFCNRLAFTHRKDCPCFHLEACLVCGKSAPPMEERSLTVGSGAVELGFAKPETVAPTGICTASSFSFAQQPEEVYAHCRRHTSQEAIVDEYGQRLSGAAFLQMLEANVPPSLRFTRSIGVEFS